MHALAASASGAVEGQGRQGPGLPGLVKEVKAMAPAFRFLTCADGSIETQPGRMSWDAMGCHGLQKSRSATYFTLW